MNPLPASGEWTDSPEIPAQQAQLVSVAALPAKLNVVLPFVETDMAQVVRLLQWCHELSGQLPYSLFLLPFKGINFTEVRMHAERAFIDVQVILDSEGVISDWKQEAKIRDAAGPNSMFRQAAWHFYFHQALGPWLYLEPDCVPLKKDWLQQLEADYRESGQPILGVEMTGMDRPCLNGVAIYPANLIQIAPDIVTRAMWQQNPEYEIAFDIAGSAQALAKAHLTDKIQFSYRKPPAELNWNEVYGAVEFNVVLFHGDRSGLLLESLREQTTFPAVEERCPPADQVPASPVNDAPIPAVNGECRSDKGAAGNMSIADTIRFHCDALLKLVSEKPSRGQQILDELRKRKLAPHARKQKPLQKWKKNVRAAKSCSP